MTNVKLKLMFFLLNALLTADIVQARPYSDNTTDLIIKFNSNGTYLPVQSNADTLIVANDDARTSEEIRKNEEEVNQRSNNAMDELMNSEHARDQDLSKKVMKDFDAPEDPNANKSLNTHLDAVMASEQDRDVEISERSIKEYPVLEMTKVDADAFEKQLNNSSPFLEELIDSETDREETLTDILFRPESEALVEPPRFEFLIAAKVNESASNKSVSVKSDNNLDIMDRNSSDPRKMDYVELVEVLKPSKGENKSAYNLGNITANEVDNDLAPDTRFTDMQTLFLACFGTLVPLLLVLFATLLIRCMCRRWCPGCCNKKTDSSLSDSSEKQDPSHQQLKSGEDGSGDTVGSGDGPPANGSIITMTLKNNHLIVETEERNDITKNGRETKMKYSPDNDGIFVVEVQQSTAYRPNKSLQNSPPRDPQISTNQALIHRVPEDLEKKSEEDSEKSSKYDKALALSSTGLSISDLSMSSIGSHNVSYSYGSQLGYEHGPFGYPVYAGYDVKEEVEGITNDNSQEPLISKTPTDPDKPIVTAAIFKQDSIIGSDALQGPGYCIEGSTDGPLLSDVMAREASLQHLQNKKLENGVAVVISDKIESPKKALNRADSLPVRLEQQKVPEPVVEKNQNMIPIEEHVIDVEVPKDALRGKRASLPTIKSDVYESVKDAIRPSGSPKFEKLMNDVSPGEGSFDQPPMITITEENEPGKSDLS